VNGTSSSRLRLAGIPDRFAAGAPIDPRCAAWADAAERGVKAGRPYDGTFLVLTGERGSGKTTTACGILLRCLEHRLGRFTTFARMCDDIRAEFHESSPSQVASGYANTALLVLDDLGREHLTDWSSERLFTLIDSRWANRRWTVITTNYGLGELNAKWRSAVDAEFADALCSRLADKRNTFVRFQGDRRTA
jgi:DNA replication protein DnaC